jgi:hypothetical protein
MVDQLGRHGGSIREAWWINQGGMVDQLGRHGGSIREAWWINGSVPDCCPAVQGSNLVSPQPTADFQSPGGLTPGMALGCGLTSVRGNRGENYKNEPLVRQKHIKKKKIICAHVAAKSFMRNTR